MYVAPKHVPTETPTPEPTPTLDAGPEPQTVWDRYTRDQYAELIPDAALGVSWGQVIATGERYDPEVTPDGMKRTEQEADLPTMLHELETRMAEGITRTEGVIPRRCETRWLGRVCETEGIPVGMGAPGDPAGADDR